jgi:preprotein translocase subunit SecB
MAKLDTENPLNFAVHNIYVKDISFEAPNSPHVFTLEWNPKLEFDIEMGKASLESDLYEVTMSITVSVSVMPGKKGEQQADPNAENVTAFIVEIKQAGIFVLQGVEDAQQLDYILSTTAPTILFPYAREAVSNLVTKGGFPQLVIPPMNFEAMYQQHLAQQQVPAEAAMA